MIAPTNTTDSHDEPNKEVLKIIAKPSTKEANTAPAQLPSPPMIHTARALIKILYPASAVTFPKGRMTTAAKPAKADPMDREMTAARSESIPSIIAACSS